MIAVSGTLDPDAAGTYGRIADINAYRAYTLVDSVWTVWYDSVLVKYIISQYPGDTPELSEPFWDKIADPTNIEGAYQADSPATGEATVAAV